MRKRVLIKIVGILLAGVLVFILLIFNSEKFLVEYWFQKRIDSFSCIEPLENTNLSGPVLTYSLFDESGIDLDIALRQNGLVSVGRHNHERNSADRKVYYFEADTSIVNKIFRDFHRVFGHSDITSVDDHLNARYYSLVFMDSDTGREVETGYYNVRPKKRFLDFRRRFLDIGNDVIDEIEN